MTERRHTQLTLTSVVLYGLCIQSPEELMDAELQRIDKLLDDKLLVDIVFEALQRRWRHSATHGRRSTPAEVVLRLLVLRKMRNWTFDRLEWEVTGNIAYRRFCRLDAHKVPDAKTMIRLEQLLGGETLERIFGRVDTTVVEAPIHYPTDSSLCEDIVRVIRAGGVPASA